MTAFSDLLSKVLTEVLVDKENDEIRFTTDDGKSYLMFHSQDCCERVEIEDVNGDVADLIGAPILRAEEATSDAWPMALPEPEYRDESFTWTFYKLATIKGSVDIRWFGSSNGCYSESVEFAEAA